MKTKNLLIAGAFGLLMAGCAVQQPSGQQDSSQSYPQPDEPNYYSYENWRGPGFYYGVFFSTEDRYRHWHRQRRGHGHRRHGYPRHHRHGGRRR